ncbi:GNAT family N-acetyltransferase [Kutzneria kofuensis]|uniref:Ribosomal protein S18 acetylase RimI-like enzyme n=1 Tax=Kutzneria kofuensis TaxID=103725 RepID=A0A7W9NLP1_9PSEU|nr:GNAT family N-acetyltransferase [Kutzneria kofuensis]MBB5897230.1 ribosomal protein S18 acetylase RimI-like enzyme [Kutzneria kofuensis]
MTDSLSVLDNPVLTSLSGPHARFTERHGRVVRYPADVAPFLALPDQPDEAAWRDLAEFAGPGAEVTITAGVVTPPADWEVVAEFPAVQLVDDGVAGVEDAEAVPLGPADVPEMIDLVERTRPGPFLPRTIELGSYLGIRRGGALVAMAGERMRPPGCTEISAVCTDPDHRGQGLAARLVLAVAAGIQSRGEIPFLHATQTNTGAIRLYESLGFRVHRRPVFVVTRVGSLARV